MYRISCGYSKRMPDGSVVRYKAGSTVDLTPEDLARLHPSYVQEVAGTDTGHPEGTDTVPADTGFKPPPLPVTDPSIWVPRNLDSPEDKSIDGE